MIENKFVQIVISKLEETATREQFVELHRQTAEWLAAHPDCISYEVFEGENGATADRIVWRSKASAIRGNEAYAKTEIMAGMQQIIASYTPFLGVPLSF